MAHLSLPGVETCPGIRTGGHREIIVTIGRSRERQLAAGARLATDSHSSAIEIGAAPTVNGRTRSIADRNGRIEVAGVVGERDWIGTRAACSSTGVERGRHGTHGGHRQSTRSRAGTGTAPMIADACSGSRWLIQCLLQ